jgi:hypothetical protein
MWIGCILPAEKAAKAVEGDFKAWAGVIGPGVAPGSTADSTQLTQPGIIFRFALR